MLFKLSTLSYLNNAYEIFMKNKVQIYTWHIDNFILIIKKIVKLINTIYKKNEHPILLE